MEFPKGIQSLGNPKTHVLLLLQNIYGKRQSGRVWNIFMTNKLVNELKFQQSKIDECVFYKGKSIILIYVDDVILVGPDDQEIDDIVKIMAGAFKITDEGTLADYLGVKIRRDENGGLLMTQGHMIESILNDLGIDENTKKKATTPAFPSKLLTRDEDGEEFNKSWDYRSVIGKLNYLEKCTRPDLAFSVHQCARFASNPRRSHAEAVERIGHYLYNNKEQGIMVHPDTSNENFICWADAAFAGEWNKETALNDPTTAKSRTGYVISYAGCPLTWASKLQTEIALSTVEAEYIALSQSLREVICMMQMVEEAKSKQIPIRTNAQTAVHCNAFEDNTGALELSKVPKMRPRTKHINIKYHHFREHVQKGTITVEHVDTKNQVADIFTKPLAAPLFLKHCKDIMGW